MDRVTAQFRASVVEVAGHFIEVHSSIIEKQERYLLSNDNIIGVRECVSIRFIVEQ
jgi:hypothetical protein